MKRLLILSILMIIVKLGYSQLNPMGSTYFQNQYQVNPAMVGIMPGWELDAAYKAQWTSIDGAPSMQSVTLGYGLKSKRIGMGINFYNESAGVVRRTSVKGTYAFHLPLNDEDSYLDFGVSAGIMDEWIDFSKVKGDASDQSLYNFNQRQTYLDGDFGTAFRYDALTVQGSLPNLKRLFNQDMRRAVVDRMLYMAAISYKFSYNEDFILSSLEPKVVYRGVDNYHNILDVGANALISGNKLMMSAMYHSTGSVTFGAGTTYQDKLMILGQYTTNTSDLRKYSNGEFEVAIKYKF